MSPRLRNSLIVPIILAGGLGYWASQNIVVRNLIYILYYLTDPRDNLNADTAIALTPGAAAT